MMLVMTMMGVGMMVVEGITFDGHEVPVEGLVPPLFMSEDLGRWEWHNDTLAAAMVMKASLRSVKVPYSV